MMLAFGRMILAYLVVLTALITASLADNSVSLITPAPWLASLSQTTVLHTDTFTCSGSTTVKTTGFVVPAPTATTEALDIPGHSLPQASIAASSEPTSNGMPEVMERLTVTSSEPSNRPTGIITSTPTSYAESLASTLPIVSAPSSLALSPSKSIPGSGGQSSAASSICPIGTLVASATAPAPPVGTNVYNIPGNAPYSISETALLSAISFPNGFNCENKLVILQPGTAVPAYDTFSNTFIPAFSNPQTIDQIGAVDIMVVSIPTFSLGPAWETAEYIAYAMDYANLVLHRPGTIIAWSQGNLNVQWAFKYWPSTRTNLPGRNYVAISADYDGTIEATFLCEPVSILTGGTGVALLDEFITGGGLSTVLGAIGIDKVPTDASGMSDPTAFKALMLDLVYGDAAAGGTIALSSSAFSSASSSSSSSSSFSPSFTSSALLLSESSMHSASQFSGTSEVFAANPTTSSSSSSYSETNYIALSSSSAFHSSLTNSPPVSTAVTSDVPLATLTALGGFGTPKGKRAVPFGQTEAVVARLRENVQKRQNTPIGALQDLLSGVSDSVLNELATIVVNPQAPITQIFANLAKLVTDPQQFSVVPTGCTPGVWDQVYFSNFVQTLAKDGGALAYVPTTSIFSLTDEVVEPQGVTGETNASGYMSGSNDASSAVENILIQSHCSVISNTLEADFPPLITHEGVLASGMGVAAAVLAVQSGSAVSYDQIVSTFGQAEACALISQRLTVADFLGNEATIPGALLRVTVNPGTMIQSAQFVPEEQALPSYA